MEVWGEVENWGYFCYCESIILQQYFIMENKQVSTRVAKFSGWGTMLLDLPWMGILSVLWKIGRKVLRGMANEGVYETPVSYTHLRAHETGNDPRGTNLGWLLFLLRTLH